MKLIEFIKKEVVLCISFLAAAISAFFVPPDSAYLGYIDFHVLVLLFCLMAVVAGVQGCGLFHVMAQRICKGEKSLRYIILILVLLPFFTSMLITNDVALITFVPFAILVLSSMGKRKQMIFTIVLQTIAANLGSMATPVGNPQNLFLYSRFFSYPIEFFKITVPYTVLALGLIALAMLFVKNERVHVLFDDNVELKDRRKLILWCTLFVLCLFAVFHMLNDWVLLAIVLCAMLAFDRSLFSKVDYSLLLTFVCFFVFAGNIARIDSIRTFIESCMVRMPGACTVAASQVISNVPAAVMLSNFTDDGRALLINSNIGGLGTIVASLASLISFKFYLREENAKPLKYLLVFTLWNVIILAVMCAFSIM